MNIHYLQHVPYEDLGMLQKWVYSPAHRVSATKFFEDDKLPFVDSFDMLIIMGGPMSVGDHELFPWLEKEKELISKAIAKNKMILGICLGAQLLADVLGAKVYPNKEKEIGWFPLKFYTDRHPLAAVFPAQLRVFHWHGDTFDLPAQSILIASSEACQNQAYLIGNQILALQFHLETSPDLIQQFLDNGQDELDKGGCFVQKSDWINEISTQTDSHHEELVFKLMNEWVKLNGFEPI
jgi:GMP synthase (glutamine-hydrolysing)